MYKLNSSPGRTIIIDEEEFLYFSGTAYLGIPKDPEFLSLVTEGLEKYGTNFGGSRRSNIQFDIFEKAESLLAKITGAEAALTLSSGTVAGQLLAHHFTGKAKMYFTPDAHPAMVPPGKTFHRLNNGWENQMTGMFKNTKEPVVLFANAVNSLQVEQGNFSWVEKVPENIPFTLVVDDSHSLGMCGIKGGGAHTSINVPDHVELIVISSLGKAFCVPAGVILSSEKRIRELWQSPLFGGASPTVLAYLYAFVKGQHIYKKNRAQLLNNVNWFSDQLKNKNSFQYFENYPVFSARNDGLADILRKEKILLSSFRYPSSTSPLVTRIVISSLHQRADLDKLLYHLNTG